MDYDTEARRNQWVAETLRIPGGVYRDDADFIARESVDGATVGTIIGAGRVLVDAVTGTEYPVPAEFALG